MFGRLFVIFNGLICNFPAINNSTFNHEILVILNLHNKFFLSTKSFNTQYT